MTGKLQTHFWTIQTVGAILNVQKQMSEQCNIVQTVISCSQKLAKQTFDLTSVCEREHRTYGL